MDKLPSSWLPADLQAILDEISQHRQVWLVGGAVRDALLQRPRSDFDFAVSHDARRMARRLADSLKAYYYELDAERDAGRVILPVVSGAQQTFDFAVLRGSTIEEDLRGRDFTINAMAVPLDAAQVVLDPCGGLADLSAGLLRACHEGSIEDDPLRCLRAVRLAFEFQLHIERETQRLIVRAGKNLPLMAAERVRDELMRMLDQARPEKPVGMLGELELAGFVLPEVWQGDSAEQGSEKAKWGRALSILAALSDILGVMLQEIDPGVAGDPTLTQLALALAPYRAFLAQHLSVPLSSGRTARQTLHLAALFNGAGAEKDEGQDIRDARIKAAVGRARALCLSRAEIARLELALRHQSSLGPMLGEGEISGREAYRFFKQAGKAGIEACLLWLGWTLAEDPTPAGAAWRDRLALVAALWQAYFIEPDKVVNPPPLIRGDELAAALGLEPGPILGQLVEHIREAQAAGEISDRAQALALARRVLKM
jgi:poly(A) polymerase